MNVGKPRFHGERARALRKARGLSARKVAARVGIHWRYYPVADIFSAREEIGS